MDRNLSLSIKFKGQAKPNAQAVPLQEGYLKIGGVVDPTATAGLSFGVVASGAAADISKLKAGTASGRIVRGVSVFDDSIAQNAPAHPDKYLAGLPCAVINHGFFWLASWTKVATGATDPAIGAVVIFDNSTGAIEFLAAGTESAPEGYTILGTASVRDVDADNGALIYLN